MTNNKTILNWLEEMKELVTPDNVVWIDGSEEQIEDLRRSSICYYHRTAVRPAKQAR